MFLLIVGFFLAFGIVSLGCTNSTIEVSFDAKKKDKEQEDTSSTTPSKINYEPYDLPSPNIDIQYEYADLNLPDHFSNPNSPYGVVITSDNTPLDNPSTNAGATLGRVLFYDRRLSQNNTTSCASCHIQEYGFSDPRQFSVGLYGDPTERHSMPLVNVRYYLTGHMFWDERAESLEIQALEAITHPLEMDMDLDVLEGKLADTSFYPVLFEAAFDSPEITEERIAKAIGQFVRSMVSFNSKYDQAFLVSEDGVPNFEAVFTESELLGNDLFGSVLNPSNADVVDEDGEDNGSLRCDTCHRTVNQFSGLAIGALPDNLEGPFATNNGLDAITIDEGAGDARFKSPTLRNIAVRGRFMHDGRFTTLEQVVEFYNSGIQDHFYLHRLLREFVAAESHDGFPPPVKFNLTDEEKKALVDFMKTLTDETFLEDPKYSDPFTYDE